MNEKQIKDKTNCQIKSGQKNITTIVLAMEMQIQSLGIKQKYAQKKKII